MIFPPLVEAQDHDKAARRIHDMQYRSDKEVDPLGNQPVLPQILHGTHVADEHVCDQKLVFERVEQIGNNADQCDPEGNDMKELRSLKDETVGQDTSDIEVQDRACQATERGLVVESH